MSEMRQRKGQQAGAEENTSDSPTTKASNYYNAFVCKAPSALAPYLSKAGPYVVQSTIILQQILPIFEIAYDKSQTLMIFLEPYKVKLLFPALCGLIMCFFGGSFMTIIAAVEAYRMCGYQSSLDAVNSIIEDMNAFLKANSDDDKRDDDNDGIADVKQISGQELAQRKTLLFLRTVHPTKLGNALAGLQAGFLAVIATLKLQFAKALTLGSAIAAVLEKPANTYVVPSLEAGMPAEYTQWAEPVVNCVIRSIAVSTAWWLQRIISAIHSAIRGGVMASRNLCEYVTEMGIMNLDPNETIADEVIGYCLAASGLMFQLRYGFGLPFPLNLLLLPFTLLEYTLIWAVGS